MAKQTVPDSVSLTQTDRETDGMLIDSSWMTGRPAATGQGQGALSNYKAYICQRPQRLFNENDLWLKLEQRGGGEIKIVIWGLWSSHVFST